MLQQDGPSQGTLKVMMLNQCVNDTLQTVLHS